MSEPLCLQSKYRIASLVSVRRKENRSSITGLEFDKQRGDFDSGTAARCRWGRDLQRRSCKGMNRQAGSSRCGDLAAST
jgi:hypothetical protein